MYNIFKMGFYRLRNSPSFWSMIITGVVLGFVWIVLLYTRLDLTMFGIDIVNPQMPQLFVNGNWQYTAIISGGLSTGALLVVCSIVIPIITNGVTETGYIQSIIGQLKDRRTWITGELFIIVYKVGVLMIANILSMTFFSILFFNKQLEYNNILLLLLLLFIQYMLHISFSFFVTAVCVLTKNIAVSSIVGVLCSFGIDTTIFNMFSVLINQISKTDLADFSLVAIENHVHRINVIADSVTIMEALVVSVLLITITVFVARQTYKHRDFG